MRTVENVTNLIGRVLIAGLFLPAGFSKLMGFEGTVGYFSSLGLVVPSVLAVAVIVLEILGGVTLLLGYKTRITAVILALFTLGASIIGHAYWSVPADQVFIAKLLFYKNLAIIGGLVILASTGSGQLSMDRKKTS